MNTCSWKPLWINLSLCLKSFIHSFGLDTDIFTLKNPIIGISTYIILVWYLVLLWDEKCCSALGGILWLSEMKEC